MSLTPAFVFQIGAACRSAPVAQKLLFAPTGQAGTEMRTAAALGGQPVAALRVTTVVSEANRLVGISAPGRQGRRVSWNVAEVMVEQLLAEEDLPPENPMRASAASVTRTIRDLRMAAIDPDTYRKTAKSPFARTVFRIYRRYTERLDAEGLMDDAAVLDIAVEWLHSGKVPQACLPEMILVSDGVDLPDAAYRFVDALGAVAATRYRISDEREGAMVLVSAAPRLSAAARFADWPVPDAQVPASAPPPVVAAAMGAENELRAVARRILSARIPLDSVEIAYPAHHPYLQLIRETMGRIGMPVTLAAGVPATDTTPGQAVRLYLTWLDGGMRSAALTSLLRSGLVRLPGDGRDFALQAADKLDSIRIGSGARAYGVALDHLRRAERTDDDRMRHDRIVDAIMNWLRYVPDQAPLTPAVLSGAIDRFIQSFVKRRKGDEALRKEIATRFAEFGQLAGSRPVDKRLLIRRYLDLLNRMFVHARASRPGHIHAVPLSSAGFTGRSSLFVVGLDQQTFGARPSEDAFLPDSEREALHGAPCMPYASDRVSRSRWLLQRAMARAGAGTYLTVNRYDVADDRELYPSSACLEVMAQTDFDLDELVVHGFVPSGKGDAAAAIEATEAVLAARRARDTALFVRETFTHANRRHHAERAFRSADWTAWDGVVEGRLGLDPLQSGKRMSPSRLETLAACPYRYFLKYILHIRVPDIRDDDRWIEGRESGEIIHRAFSDVVSSAMLSGDSLASVPEDQLLAQLDAALDQFAQRSEPPHPAALDRVRRDLHAAARVFLADERSHPNRVPVAAELGFGLRPDEIRSESDHVGDYAVQLGERSIPLRGFIDRIDRLADGGLGVRDYKTGSAIPFAGGDLLRFGGRLQWALYGYAAEDVLGEAVASSGYVFMSDREMGLEFKSPLPDRPQLGRTIGEMTDRAAAGLFPHAAGSDACKFCDFKRVCGDLDERKLAVSAKLESAEHAPLLESWRR